MNDGKVDLLKNKYGIRRPNKAHTATAHRIAKLFETEFNEGEGFDIQTPLATVEVETTATMMDAAARLVQLPGNVYIAMTNKDGVKDALRATQGTRIGIMDPLGNIVRPSLPLA
jgi:hypothetical protein